MTATRINPHEFQFLGTNPTGGTSNDTRAFWVGKGCGWAWISGSGQLNGQPGDYGFLINMVYDGDVHQEFWVQPDGPHHKRGAHSSHTTMPSFRSVTNDLLVVEQYSYTTTINTVDTYWKIEASKSGYTPIMYTPLLHGWAAQIVIGPENLTMSSGYFCIDGYGKSLTRAVTPTIYVKVLWMKN